MFEKSTGGGSGTEKSIGSIGAGVDIGGSVVPGMGAAGAIAGAFIGAMLLWKLLRKPPPAGAPAARPVLGARFAASPVDGARLAASPVDGARLAASPLPYPRFMGEGVAISECSVVAGLYHISQCVKSTIRSER
jgi:hypothetical protein